ncbi:MAG: ABC transporter ATP-binding protein [Desulfomonilaceae bacterium]
MQTLVELHNVSVSQGRTVILSGISWTLSTGQNWAILGRNGAGKTTFLKLVRGDIWPDPKGGLRLFHINGTARKSPIGFREKTGVVSSELLDTYKRNGRNIRGLDVVLSGFFDSAYLHQATDAKQIARSKEVIASLSIDDLIEKDFLSLSLGQAKRILIARAIVHGPRLLILDELGTGLDRESKKTVMEIVQGLTENGTQILCSTHIEEDLLSVVTHCLQLDEGKIVGNGPKEEMPAMARKEPAKLFAPRTPEHSAVSNGNPLITIKDVDVFRKGKPVLHRINWTIKPGENWAVLGRNGSGKTTLLRLISGDLAPAWGGSISRFGIESHNLWEIRRKLSLVSADLQAWHEYRRTGLDAVVSGFFGSIGVHNTVAEHQSLTARQWLQDYDLEELAERDIQTLSYGQLRILLIMRAMVTNPMMLLLDEPLSGLDKKVRSQVLNLLDSLASKGTVLVYVTHRISELPLSITKALVLKNGTVDFCGDVEAAR